jgi:preprotein translocase subunit YajC
MTNTTHLLLLQSSMDPGTLNFLFLGGMLIVLYFFIIRPQAKKQKLQNKFVEELKEGDRVVTTSGLFGRIAKVEKTTLVLDIGAGTKTAIRVLKSAVSKEMTENAGKEIVD